MLEEDLVELGFTQSEARVYLALVKQGSLSAHEISRSTGLYRPSVYDVLNALIERGLASFVLVEGKKRFKAADQTALKDYFHHRQEKLDEVVAQLSRFSQKQHEHASVEVYRGKQAVKKAFRDILDILIKTRVTHLGLGIDDKYFVEDDARFSEWFIRQLEKNGLKEKMITYEGTTVFAGGKTTEFRFIPKEFFNPAISPTSILIDADLVTLIIWTEPKYVIKIWSGAVADSYRRQFEHLWKSSKKLDWKTYFKPRKLKK